MTEDNKIENSIIPIGSTGLVRVGNSIDITKKLISQGEKSILGLKNIRFVPFNKNDKWYLYDLNLKFLINVEFDFIYLFILNIKYNSYCILVKHKQKAFCGNTFNYSNLEWFDEITPLANFKHLLIVKKESCYLLKNHDFLKVLPDCFDEIIELKLRVTYNSSNHLLLKKNGQCGLFCCESQSLVLPIEFDEIEIYSLGKQDSDFKIKSNNKTGIYSSRDRKFIINPIFDDVVSRQDNIYVVEINNKFKLFNISNNSFLNGSEYTKINGRHSISFEDGYFLVNKNYQRFLVDIHGIEYYIGDFKEVERKGNWILCSDDLLSFHLFKKTKLIVSLYRDWDRMHMLNFTVIKNMYLQLTYNVAGAFDSTYKQIIGNYDFKGNKIDNDIIHSLQDTEKFQSNFENKTNNDIITISDTFWSVQKDGLFFRNKLIYNIELNNLSDFCVSEFNSGFAFVEISDGDCYYDSIGYIDVYGNNYWNFDDNLDS